MKSAVALVALCALLIGLAPRASAEDSAETGPGTEAAPGSTKGTASTPGPHSSGSASGPAASPVPGDVTTQPGELQDEDTLSPRDDDPLAENPYASTPSGDDGDVEDESSLLDAPEGRGARAHDDPFSADSDDIDSDDNDED